jgi:LPS-assembly protein
MSVDYPGRRMSRAAALLVACCIPAQLCAAEPEEPPPAAGEILVRADRMILEEATDRLAAEGQVRLRRDAYRLRADRVTWDRGKDLIGADGMVAIDDPSGNTLYATSVQLDGAMKNGEVADPLITLEGRRRLAGNRAVRVDGITTLERAVYTACAVVDDDGCPKSPFWTITATTITHDEERHRISYRDARLNMLGMPVLWLPGLSHPDGSDEGNGSGLLVPDIRFTATRGLEYVQPYYIRTRPDRDLTLSPHLYSGALPMLEAHYRRLLGTGGFQVKGYLTSAERLPADVIDPRPDQDRQSLSGAIEASGRFQPDPLWTLQGSIRVATDRSFLRRYEISDDDRLRSMVSAERIDDASYLSISGAAFQILRFSDANEGQALALPAIAYRRRLADPIAGGTVDVEANLLSLLRSDGQSMQRAIVGTNWHASRIDDGGRVWTLTGLARVDGYHVDPDGTATAEAYRGSKGWSGRSIAASALDMRWPLVAPLGNGHQTIIPRLQLAASALTAPRRLPNEDSRAADLEETSLFSLNPLPGYDRWADGSRLSYGIDWLYDRPGWALRATIGQSLNIVRPTSDLPSASGLEGRTTDIVAGAGLRIGRTWRFASHLRLDDDMKRLRRIDADATWNGGPLLATLSYTRLDRDGTRPNGDLPDHEELRVAGRVRFARYWSVSASTIINLTGRNEDPLAIGDSFQPVRRRIGIGYDDDCISLGLNWRREYDVTGNASGNNFGLRIAIKTLGR